MIYLLIPLVAVAIPACWTVAIVRSFFRPRWERAEQIRARLFFVRAQNYARSTSVARANAATQVAVALASFIIIAIIVMILAYNLPARGGGIGIIVIELLVTLIVSQIRAHHLAKRAKKEMVEELRARPATVAGSQISHTLQD